MRGCMRAIEEVSPAKNSKKNHRKPKNSPAGIWANIAGRLTKPRLKAPDLAITTALATPKKATAVGMAREPPKTTSAV